MGLRWACVAGAGIEPAHAGHVCPGSTTELPDIGGVPGLAPGKAAGSASSLGAFTVATPMVPIAQVLTLAG